MSSVILITSRRFSAIVIPMDRKGALERLPEPYATALRLRDAGLGHEICSRLAVPQESVEPLLAFTDAKLAALLLDGADADMT